MSIKTYELTYYIKQNNSESMHTCIIISTSAEEARDAFDYNYEEFDSNGVRQRPHPFRIKVRRIY